MKHRVISFALALCMILSCGISAAFPADAAVSKGYIDNSPLTPAFVTDDKVTLVPTNGGKLMSPDWINSLIIEEVNIMNVSPNGRFSGMTYVLDHLQEMGVNGLWVTPIYGGVHYLNYGPRTVDSYLTGTSDYEEGWKVVADFVNEAHKRNIRVFLDIVTWGASPYAPIVAEHPEWFPTHNERYNGEEYDWKNEELIDWFSEAMIDIVHKTDIDGFRADCGIDYGCKELYKRVRSELYAEGNYIALIGEAVNDNTLDIFDFDEHSVNYEISTQGENYIDGSLNMISAIKTGYGLDTMSSQKNGTAGQHTYYTSLVSCHDTKKYIGNGSLVPMAYGSVLSPFIPLWYCGEEWNNTYTSTGWLWDTGIYWGELETNRDYYETIKAYMRIRRTFPEIFNYFPLNHRDINICEVKTDHTNATLHSYARYADGKGILVVPNQGEMTERFEITIPYKDMGLSEDGTYTVENLLTGKIVATGNAGSLKGIAANIANQNVAVYLVRPAAADETPTLQTGSDTTKKPTNSNTNNTVGKPTVISTESKTDNSTEKTPENSDTNDDKDSSETNEKPVSKVEDNKFPIGWVVGGALVLIIIAGGIITTVIIKKKKT
ncbi:MAG: alpha-amylase family glycosyl hydrolase [Oscillospiraceae bacterium]|nr:alpha-amylase family glycosyl hydrolase [Oscillospiraceae bacterium]